MDDVSGVDVMVDLETLDTGPLSKILSIGACVVPWSSDEPLDHFYIVLDHEDQERYNRTESKSTREWWDKQDEEARKVFTDPDKYTFENGLLTFRQYISRLGHFKKIRVWGNGSDFDNVILITAFNAIGVTPPWPFYNNRCFRTIKSELSHAIQEPVRAGTHHNALDDALHQARWLSKASKIIRPTSDKDW